MDNPPGVSLTLLIGSTEGTFSLLLSGQQLKFKSSDSKNNEHLDERLCCGMFDVVFSCCSTTKDLNHLLHFLSSDLVCVSKTNPRLNT